MKVIFNNVGKIGAGLVAAYGTSVDQNNNPISGASVTLVEPRGGKLLEAEPGRVYELSLVDATPTPVPPAPSA